ncbi:acyltransferase family protein [Rugamonas rubra]|uniref:Predicted acyltransferase n=1 Tax=Rugamonas rubra TaxID=758825 RepID=A0A1I4PJS2_9BURK|nr:heparan-alpha-glucosaminide N-acetyltransferase domain-containing protein [Rugamonas rubra]SFM28081.1 Predicted acyltransferase [Rugamonas rubra]
MQASTASKTRISSIDALRGLTVAAMLVVNDAGDWGHVYTWLEHAEWHGCTPADFIFPFFLLIVGISIELAVGRPLDAGAAPGPLARAVLVRGGRIVLLGLALHLAATLLLDGRGFRLMGVLQRIGICFGAAGLAAIYLRDARRQWATFSAILLGYWALLAWGGPLLPGLNLADRVDTALLGRLAYQYDASSGLAHDPEGVLSTLPALATVLLGVRAGAWLRSGQMGKLLLAGAGALALGAAWSLLLPFNKQLWTSSFVLWTGGFGLLAVVAAHWLIDQRGWPALGRSLGVNAIAAYAGSWLATCLLEGSGLMTPLYRALFAPLTPLAGPFLPSLLFALVFTGAFWLLMRWFAARGWRIVV